VVLLWEREQQMTSSGHYRRFQGGLLLQPGDTVFQQRQDTMEAWTAKHSPFLVRPGDRLIPLPDQPAGGMADLNVSLS